MNPWPARDLPDRPSDRRTYRRTYASANSFELMLSVSAIIAGVSGIVSQDAAADSALGDVFGRIAIAWSVAYIVSGLGALYGLLRIDQRVEIMSLLVLGGAIAGNAVALVGVRGWMGAPSAAFYLGWAAACALRAWRVSKGARMVKLGPY